MEPPCLEETPANKADEPLHPTLLIASGRCDGAWLEAVVSGEFEQRGMCCFARNFVTDFSVCF